MEMLLKVMLCALCLLALAGCGEPREYDDSRYYVTADSEQNGWGRKLTGNHRVRTEKHIVAVFESYAEADSVCRVLNESAPSPRGKQGED